MENEITQNESMGYIGPDELIFHKDEHDGIYSGGFSVKSIMMKAGMSPIMTINDNMKGNEEKVSDLFEDLVVPNWILSYSHFQDHLEIPSSNQKIHGKEKYEVGVVDDDLHDKLLGLVIEHTSKVQRAKQRATRKNSFGAIERKRTRKQKLKI